MSLLHLRGFRFWGIWDESPSCISTLLFREHPLSSPDWGLASPLEKRQHGAGGEFSLPLRTLRFPLKSGMVLEPQGF